MARPLLLLQEQVVNQHVGEIVRQGSFWNSRAVGVGVLIPLLLLGFQNCAAPTTGVQFSSAEGETESFAAPAPGLSTHQFEQVISKSLPQAVDLIWVVDNSGSMSEEIQQVRQHFQAFLSSTSSLSDLRVIMVSAQSGSRSLQVSTSDSRFFHLNQKVESHDAVMLAAAGLCQDFSKPQCALYAYHAFRGALRPSLRASAKKAFVFVTDDNSLASSSHFLSLFDEVLHGQALSVFSFAGQGSSASPCQHRTGFVYQNLAKKTGAESWNICDSDWSPTFSKITSRVQALSGGLIRLPHAVERIRQLQVLLDGRVLSASEFSLSSQGLSLNPSLLQDGQSATVLIRYHYEVSSSSN